MQLSPLRLPVWENDGRKKKFRKHYMNMFVRETFFLYKEKYENTEFDVSRSTSLSLRPKNVLRLKDFSTDQWKCNTYENLILTMGVNYD